MNELKMKANVVVALLLIVAVVFTCGCEPQPKVSSIPTYVGTQDKYLGAFFVWPAHFSEAGPQCRHHRQAKS